MEKMSSVLLLNMCMVMDETNNLVLTLDKINGNWQGITFPGGHVENGESIIASTIREVKEETGLTIWNLTPCGFIHWYNTDTQQRWLIFLYKTANYEGRLLAGTNEGAVAWMDCASLSNAQLAPGMDTYLKLFFNDDINEAFGTWHHDEQSGFILN